MVLFLGSAVPAAWLNTTNPDRSATRRRAARFPQPGWFVAQPAAGRGRVNRVGRPLLRAARQSCGAPADRAGFHISPAKHVPAADQPGGKLIVALPNGSDEVPRYGLLGVEPMVGLPAGAVPGWMLFLGQSIILNV